MSILVFVKHIVKLFLGREKLKISFIPHYKNKIDLYFDYFEKIENVEKCERIVAIDGVGFCGSSAVTDFLAEFSRCTVFGGVDMRENPERGAENSYEVDFFRDPYGLLDLEKICYTNVTRIRSRAISDFMTITVNNYRSNCPLYDKNYLYETNKFLHNIMNYVLDLGNKVYSYIPKNLTVVEFRKYANEYLNGFLKGIKSKEILVLDNLMSVGEGNKDLLSQYFGDNKLIYVYSDPRDIYARARLQQGNDWVPVDPELFVKFYLREFPSYLKSKYKNILCVSFDRFCNEYDSVANEIMDFVGVSEKEHEFKFKYFDPSKSINNTKVWGKIDNQAAIQYIYQHLKEYCYEV